jgi:hypothetical protein
MLELIAEQPEPVGRLKVVARRGLPVARRAAGEEAVVRMPDRRRGRDNARGEVEGGGERYKARAAASSSSKSGTSDVP